MSSATQVHLLDASERARALDATRSVIVQAPAGSGKTGLLIRRYLALLAHARRVEEVVVITFTRKAAEELRTRIIDALVNASGEAPVRQAETAHQAQLRQLALEVLSHARANEWSLIEDPSRLAIFTIDAFAARLARRLPWLAGLGGGLGVEPVAEPLYREAARNLLAYLDEDERRGKGDSANESAHQAVASLLTHLDGQLAVFEDLVTELLARREQWWPLLQQSALNREQLRASLEDGLRRGAWHAIDMVRSSLSPDLVDELIVLSQRIGAIHQGSDSEYAQLPFINAASRADCAQALTGWKALASLLLTNNNTLRVREPNRVALAPLASAEARAMRASAKPLLERLASCHDFVRALTVVKDFAPICYSDDEWQLLEGLFTVLKLALMELTVVFANHGRGDFTAIVAAAIEALGHPEEPTDLALRLDYEITHLLVDEFQDTSRTHLEFIARLCAGFTESDGRSVFLVGDPMQSIYRFRQAEVGEFLNCMRNGLGQIRLEPVRLSANFRARADIVQWVNRCFATIFPSRDDPARSAVSFSTSHAVRDAHCASGVHVHAFIDDDGQAQAARVVEIVERLQGGDTNPSIAILVRSRTHLEHILPALGRAEIRYRANELRRLGDTAVVRDLHVLARAIAHPMDRVAWLAVLRAPWCGLELSALATLIGDDYHCALRQLLGDGTRVARLKASDRLRAARVLSAIEAATIQHRYARFKRQVEAAWLLLGAPACYGPQSLEDAHRYLSLLDEMDADNQSMDAVSERLAQLYATPALDQVDVEVMTLHRAKGLEFDHVILPLLERGAAQDERRLLSWSYMPLDGGTALAVSMLPQRGEDSVRHRFVRKLEQEKQDYEQARLLYVGCTRAREQLHLLASAKRNTKGDLTEPRKSSLLCHLWAHLRGSFAALLDPARDSLMPRPALAPRSMLTRVGDDWTVPKIESFSACAPIVGDAMVSEAVEFDWAGRIARMVGTVVHGELAHITGEGVAHWDVQRIAMRRSHYAQELAALGVTEAQMNSALERVCEALARTVEDPRGRWLLGNSHLESASELGLSALINARLMRVVIDRTFIDNGIRWIVDYKTGEHTGGARETFIDTEQARYRGQLERYANWMSALEQRPIRLGLYFPMLSAWREWAPGES